MSTTEIKMIVERISDMGNAINQNKSDIIVLKESVSNLVKIESNREAVRKAQLELEEEREKKRQSHITRVIAILGIILSVVVFISNLLVKILSIP